MTIGFPAATRADNDGEVLQTLHQAAGRPFLGVDILLIHHAGPKQVIDLLDQLLDSTHAPRRPRSERGRVALSRVLAAFDGIVAALGTYEVTRDWQHRPSREGPAVWRRLADRPTRATLEILLARQDLRPEYLTRLWKAACSAGYLRVTAERRTEIKVRGEWREASIEDKAAWGLIEDEEALRKVAKVALKNLERQTSKPDYLRRFRDLRKKPTEKRFKGLLRSIYDAQRNDLNRTMAQFAARRLGLISDDLSDDDIDRIAVNPAQVHDIAALVCGCFSSHFRKNVHDKALERLGLETCRIYEELTGKVVGYATSTKPGVDRPVEKRFGHRLNVVLAALRLIDPNTTVSQAQRVIDIHRGWRL